MEHLNPKLKSLPSNALFDILTALRGPDVAHLSATRTLKNKFTTPIRQFVFPARCYSGPPLTKSRCRELSAEARAACFGVLAHWYSHIYLALDRIAPLLPEAKPLPPGTIYSYGRDSTRYLVLGPLTDEKLRAATGMGSPGSREEHICIALECGGYYRGPEQTNTARVFYRADGTEKLPPEGVSG